MIDFDNVLEKVGGFGLFQILLAGLMFYNGIVSAFNTIAPVFINYTPYFRCNVPPVDDNTMYDLTEDEILNLTTPYNAERGMYDFCQRYGYDLSSCNVSLEACVNKSAPSIPCDKGYYYDTSMFPQTVISEFDLVCDQAYLDFLATALYMVGVLLGSILFGNTADRWGRKKTLIGSSIMTFAAMFGSCFTHSFWLFVVCRIFLALFGYGIYLSSFVYLLEISSNEWRTLLGVGYQASFAIGTMILSGLAYQWRDWHELVFVSGLLAIPFGVAMFAIPESPRWLFSNGRDEEAKAISRTFAKFNKKSLDEDTIWEEAEKRGDEKQKLETEKEFEMQKYSSMDLFRTPGIRKTSFKVMFNWFVNSLVYYGISLNAGSLAGDIFVNNVINGAMEIVGYIFIIGFMERTGRRCMLIFLLALAGVALLCSTVVQEFSGDNQSLVTLGVVFAFAAKLGISGSYAVIYNLTTELFPTVVRSNAVGVASTAARLGSILSPLLLAIQSYIRWLPNVIFGVLAVIGAVMSVSFPETTGIDMMEQIDEAEDFYAGKLKRRDTKKDLVVSYNNNALKSEGDEQQVKF